jgi:hypothetical protein
MELGDELVHDALSAAVGNRRDALQRRRDLSDAEWSGHPFLQADMVAANRKMRTGRDLRGLAGPLVSGADWRRRDDQ